MTSTPSSSKALLHSLQALHDEMLQVEHQVLTDKNKLAAAFKKSARNLVHYLVLRQHDLRSLQRQLAEAGLSSLGRSEAHVLATLVSVLRVIHQSESAGKSTPNQPNGHVMLDFAEGRALLEEHTSALLGKQPSNRRCRIMVTMPSEAADDYSFIHGLLEQGMDCMRINCAHDNAEVWQRMIDHLRRAEETVGRSCRIAMDLAGPKLRTGPLPKGPAVVKVNPQRDSCGRVVVPARIWLSRSRGLSPASASSHFRVSGQWLKQVKIGDFIHFTDARDSRRKMMVTDITKDGCWADLLKTAYFTTGTRLQLKNDKETAIGQLAHTESFIRLKIGDTLRLTRNQKNGHAAELDHRGEVVTPATIGCTLPQVLEEVRVGDPIWFNDGQIGGVVQEQNARYLRIEITQAKPNGSKLRPDKGINLPNTPIHLHLDALTDDDVRNLAFVARAADIIELSFVNRPEDVDQLIKELYRLGNSRPAIVLKIETQQSFQELPALLLRLMQWPVCGVMLARGDLAVECGFERLAEVQEEILWLCEAAHLPVIWATQVLESLSKTGLPSRAEITDAAMGNRAECVMLNKGPHVLQTVQLLDGILRRMDDHQDKKNDLLRALRVATL